MEKWKFLLLGITGDLASKKILPGLSQFAEINEEKVKIDLIGYSRSQPNQENILKILNDHSSTGSHFLNSISFNQGEYNDPEYFPNFVESLEEGEKGVVYMAVPPNVFVDFLSTSCPYGDRSIHILVEKPFGRDILEAQKILDLVNACSLNERVHFTDHYNFKTQTMLESGDYLNLKSLQSKVITSIEVLALEKLGIEDRAGYFESIGTLKDMLPHILSLSKLALNLQKNKQPGNFFKDFKMLDLSWGQYKTYHRDAKAPHSETETYFKVDAESSNTKLTFESGKKLGLKKTEIKVTYSDETKVFWRIDSEKNLELISEDQELIFNLDRNKKLDHTNLFEELLEENFENFVSSQDILLEWLLYQKIVNFKNTKFVKPFLYKDNHWPIQKFVSKKS